jgi:competence protein ComEA
VKEFFKSLFGASSKEIVGFSALILVLVLSLVAPRVIKSSLAENDDYRLEDAKMLDSLVVLLEKDKSEQQIESKKVTKLHRFNPNKATVLELVELGFKEKIAQRIIKYRTKGGSFAIKSDLYKIYGIDSSLVRSLLNYIELPEQASYAEVKRPKKNLLVNSSKSSETDLVELPNFDINRADTSTLQTIKGIGSVLSNRIIDFRNKLGGFMLLDQLYEVYNLDSTVALRLIDKIFIDPEFTPEKLFINLASEKELAGHPYISWQQARLIIAYRNQHGDFSSGLDLLKVYAVEESDVRKLGSYLDSTPSN